MKAYHKIQTLFKRDPNNKFKTLLEGEYSFPEFEFLRDNPWSFTEKIDGMNIRIKKENNIITFAGKSDDAQIPGPLLKKLTELFTLEKLNNVFSESDVCLYGEGFGGKIQKGGSTYGIDQDFILFDIKIGEFWLQIKDVEGIAQKLDLKIVSLLGIGTLSEMVLMAKEGFNSVFGNFPAEGIVARPLMGLCRRNGDRIITKLKLKDFS